jgi:hypothetical protein
MKGLDLGDFMEHYFPVYSRYSQLEGVALQNVIGAKGYHIGMQRAREFVGGNLLKARGISVGKISQLRRMEELGMPPVVDKLLGKIRDDVGRMQTIVRDSYNAVKSIADPSERAEKFAEYLLNVTKGKNINTRLRLGGGQLEKEALRQMSYQLDAASGNVDKLGGKILDLSNVLMSPAQYDMMPIQAFRRYLNQMASTYSWHLAETVNPLAKGAAQKVYGFKNAINPIIESIPGSPGGWQKTYMTDNLVPLLRGLKPYKTYLRSSTMGEYKNMVRTWLTTHDLPKQLLPEESRRKMIEYFGNFKSLSSEGLGAKISEFFYVSTLGMNISPAAKNLLQNYITLLHMPGINATGIRQGMAELSPKIAKYTNLLSKGVSRDKAWVEAFPEYVRATGKSSGMTRAMVSGDIAKEGIASKIMGGGLWEKTKDVMLTPFGTSEGFNRLFGFYVAKASHYSSLASSGMTTAAKQAAAEEFGAIANHAAHFPGGPLGMPRALLGVWGPARQFMHFPTRYLGFLHSSLGWGEGMQRLTTLARTAGASAGAYTVAKNLLGTDLSQGLMMGALPIPQYEKAAFHPWPLVPPAIGILGAAAQSAASGEAEQLKRSAALMIPGGIALRKLYKTLGPKYAQYDAPTPDGRIPVYNENRALIGAFTPWQLTMKSIGLSPSSQQAEYGAAKWLLTQREKIRGFRREYLEALANNDVNRADTINRDFQKAYPELGPLQLKKSDITAVHNRREISRLHRILKGFPKAYQPLFSHMISQTGLSQITEDLERSPTALDTYSPLLYTMR